MDIYTKLRLAWNYHKFSYLQYVEYYYKPEYTEQRYRDSWENCQKAWRLYRNLSFDEIELILKDSNKYPDIK